MNSHVEDHCKIEEKPLFMNLFNLCLIPPNAIDYFIIELLKKNVSLFNLRQC